MSLLSTIDAAIAFLCSPKSVDSQIFADSQSIETTQMAATRLGTEPCFVVHDTDWSDIFRLLPNPTDWTFTLDTKRSLQDRDGWTIDVFSPTECLKLIELTEKLQYENCGYSPHYRNNDRIITSDPNFAAALFDRIVDCLPSSYSVDGEVWNICGLNDRFRWCKYTKGQKFDRHTDTRYEQNSDCKSFYTVNVYLNDGATDFEGGRTLFFKDNPHCQWTLVLDEEVAVTATPGMALIFNQYPDEIVHSGEELKGGTKYLMRTDVMYQKVL